jgi:hypothetical protein
METVKFNHSLELNQKLFRDHTYYERNRALKKSPLLLLLIIFGIIPLLGYIFHILFIFWVGAIGLLLILSFLLFYLIRVEIYITQLKNRITKTYTATENEGIFKFDEDKIIQETANYKNEMNWELIKSYDINGNTIYLFLENRVIYDIISESIIGTEAYGKFKRIISQKVKFEK